MYIESYKILYKKKFLILEPIACQLVYIPSTFVLPVLPLNAATFPLLCRVVKHSLTVTRMDHSKFLVCFRTSRPSCVTREVMERQAGCGEVDALPRTVSRAPCCHPFSAAPTGAEEPAEPATSLTILPWSLKTHWRAFLGDLCPDLPNFQPDPDKMLWLWGNTDTTCWNL